MTDLEQRIIYHLAKQGYKYLALNGGHARVFDPSLDEVPFLRGGMYRIETERNGEYQSTIFGEVIGVPGLFEDEKRVELIDLTKLEFQENLF